MGRKWSTSKLTVPIRQSVQSRRRRSPLLAGSVFCSNRQKREPQNPLLPHLEWEQQLHRRKVAKVTFLNGKVSDVQ
jgi:hypothetical protein